MEGFLALFVFGGLCVALPIGLAIWLAVVSARKARERREGLAAYATHREWEYRATDPALVQRFREPPFGRGSRPTAANVLLGRHDGRGFVAFDYSFTTTSHSGDRTSTTTHTYSVLAVHLGVTAPALSVGPTGTMRRLWEKLTSSDIEIGDPAFDQQFSVRCPTPEFARDVLHPGIVDVMQHHPDLAWRFEGDSMLVIRPGAHHPQEIEAKLHFMDAVLDRIPPHVWDRLRGTAR